MALSRSDQSLLTDWWFTIDRFGVGLVFVLLTFGLFVSLSSTPPLAIRHDLQPFFYFERHVIFASVAALLTLFISTLHPSRIYQLSSALFVLSLLAIIYVLVAGVEVNGAKRWLRLYGFSLQPSELLKPVFVVLSAAALARGGHGSKNGDLFYFYKHKIAVVLYFVCALLLILQPDFGQTLLLSLTWGVMFFLSGLPWLWVFLLLILAFAGLFGAYYFLPHVARRIDYFFNPSGENYQMERAMEVFRSSGWFGRGPGEGSIADQHLPDAHNDFIFAAIADEFGILACLLLVVLMGVFVMRTLWRIRHESNLFIRLSGAGLSFLFAMQALINMSVNLGLIPAKGMTLPLISYGGSSLVSMGLLLGMILAFTRRRPLMDPEIIPRQHEHWR